MLPRSTNWIWMLFLATACLLPAQSVESPWKAGRPANREEARKLPVRSRHPGRRHRIVQFPDAASARQNREALEAAGFRVLRFVPDRGFVVSAPVDASSFDGVSVESFDVSTKLSPELTADEEYFVIEFHPDVDAADQRAIVTDAGFQIIENPDLASEHVLAKGSFELATQVAVFDEVAYIFPAADELVQGIPTSPCSGAITDQGLVGQYITRMGEGWDGAGQNATTINYAFGNMGTKLDPTLAKAEIRRALAEWAKTARITFNEVSDLAALRSITVLFASRDHGDGYPFDGPSKVLAHTFYPAPPNAETIAGDMHFDNDEYWAIGADTDLYSVALHELGHALGLGHSDKATAVMYPYYRRATVLTDEDKTAILALYAAQDTAVTVALDSNPPASTTNTSLALSGTVTGGVGNAVVRWANSMGGSGTAQGGRIWSIASIPLQLGTNNITLTATDDNAATGTRTITIVRTVPVVVVTINSPAANSTVSSTPVTVLGTAAYPTALQQVSWRTARGDVGVASGTYNWQFQAPLVTGQNLITVTGRANDGTTGTATLTLNYNPNAEPDRTAPSITVTSPATSTVSTRAFTITLSGTASDNVGVAQVTWTNSSGGVGVASGTTNWDTGPINLLIGVNNITVRAKDAAGNTAWRTVVVTRQR